MSNPPKDKNKVRPHWWEDPEEEPCRPEPREKGKSSRIIKHYDSTIHRPVITVDDNGVAVLDRGNYTEEDDIG